MPAGGSFRYVDPNTISSDMLKEYFTMHHPSITSLLRFFQYGHLPPHLQEVSKPFGELAKAMADREPNNPETAAGIRKLLEAKDCAVRAVLEPAP